MAGILELSNVFKKGLQSELSTASIDDTALSFTTDTKRLYIEDGTNRIQITDVIFGMTESEIINNSSLLPKFYVASDTLSVYISDGSTIDKVGYVPKPIGALESQNYYPVMRSADGTTNPYGYTTDVNYNPSSKQMKVGDVRIAQTTDAISGDKTIDFYIEHPSA